MYYKAKIKATKYTKPHEKTGFFPQKMKSTCGSSHIEPAITFCHLNEMYKLSEIRRWIARL